MDLENQITGRNVTEDMTKQKQKDEERKIRIKNEKNVSYLKSQGVILMEKIQSEEVRSKDILEKKL